MQEMVARVASGRLLSAEALFTTSSVAVRDPANHLFSSERHGHGILHWLGCHWVDALLWVSGEPIVEVQAMTANVLGENIDVEDAISVAFRFAGGGLGTMHFVNAFPRPEFRRLSRVPRRQRVGQGGHERDADDPWARARGRTRSGSRSIPTSTWSPAATWPSSVVAINALVRAVREDTPVPVGLDDMARALEVIDAAYQVGRRRRPPVRIARARRVERGAARGAPEQHDHVPLTEFASAMDAGPTWDCASPTTAPRPMSAGQMARFAATITVTVRTVATLIARRTDPTPNRSARSPSPDHSDRLQRVEDHAVQGDRATAEPPRAPPTAGACWLSRCTSRSSPRAAPR